MRPIDSKAYANRPRRTSAIRLPSLPMLFIALLAFNLLSAWRGADEQELAVFQTASAQAMDLSAEAVERPANLAFSSQAMGQLPFKTSLYDAPSGGQRIETLPGGSSVQIGGEIRIASGLLARRVYWVRAELDSAVLYGFLPIDAVLVTAGAPLELDVRGVAPSAFLAPAADTAYSGGERFDGVRAQSQQTTLSQPSAIAAIDWLPDSIGPWMPLFERAGKAHGVDPQLLAILALVESGGNPRAQSPAGAMGLMQVMPTTGQYIAQQRGIAGFSSADLWEPATNVDFGAWYIAQQLRAFGQNNDPGWQRSVELAASAYNGGPGTVEAHLNRGRSLPAETRSYQRWVGGMWNERGQLNSDTFSAWWAAGGGRLVAAAERIQRVN